MNLLDLPAEILNEIASHLPVEAVVAFERTAKYPNAVCVASDFWHRLVKRDFIKYLSPPADKEETSALEAIIGLLVEKGEWRYLHCILARIPALAGVWFLDDSTPYKFKLIEVRHDGRMFFGRRLTGDFDFPAGEMMFAAILNMKQDMELEGYGLFNLADEDEENKEPSWCKFEMETIQATEMVGSWIVPGEFAMRVQYRRAENLTVDEVNKAIAANGPPDIFGSVDSDAVLQTLGWTPKSVAKLFPEHEADSENSESYQEAMRDYAKWEDNYDSDDSEYQDDAVDDYDGKEDAVDELP
jgi:hypothetical protein